MSLQENIEGMMYNKVMAAIIVAAMVGLLSWNVYTTQELTVQMAVVRDRVENISVENFSTRASLLEQRVGRLEEWVGRLSTRLADVEAEERARLRREEDKQ